MWVWESRVIISYFRYMKIIVLVWVKSGGGLNLDWGVGDGDGEKWMDLRYVE